MNRGGSWNNAAVNCTVSFRNYNTPSNLNYNIGFRLALQLSRLGYSDKVRVKANIKRKRISSPGNEQDISPVCPKRGAAKRGIGLPGNRSSDAGSLRP